MTRKVWRDREISAYVDGRLESQEAIQLESALARDPKLQERVASMQQAVTWVQSMPLRDTPRNYLLTPSMVAETKKTPAPSTPRRRPLWVMQLATSVTALAFVFALSLNLLSVGGRGAMPDSLPRAYDEEVLGVAEAIAVEPMTSLEMPADSALVPDPEMPVPQAEPGEGDTPVELLADAPEGVLEGDPVPEASDFAGAEVENAQRVEMGNGASITRTDEMPIPELRDVVEDVPPPQPPFPPRWLTFSLGVLTLMLGGVTFWLSRQS